MSPFPPKNGYDLATKNCALLAHWIFKRAGVRLPSYRVALGYFPNDWMKAVEKDAKTNRAVVNQGKWELIPEKKQY